MLPRANEVEAENEMVPISARIPKALNDKLEAICEKEYRSKSNLIVILLEKALKESA